MKRNILRICQSVIAVMICLIMILSTGTICMADSFAEDISGADDDPFDILTMDEVPENKSDIETFSFIEDGELITLKRITTDSCTLVVAEDSNGNNIASAITAFDGNGIIVSDEIGTHRLCDSNPTTTSGKAAIRKAGTTWGKEQYYTWSVGTVVNVATTAVKIACTMSGISLGVAYDIAETIVKSAAKNVWAKTGVSYRTDSQYLHCRRRTWFYRNSACTSLICGPSVAYQKKALDA